MDKPEPTSREPAAGQSARFRIKVDRLGRVIPEIEIVDDDDETAATTEPRPQPSR
jgi:hypothetical protein